MCCARRDKISKPRLEQMNELAKLKHRQMVLLQVERHEDTVQSQADKVSRENKAGSKEVGPHSGDGWVIDTTVGPGSFLWLCHFLCKWVWPES